jgi:hypothetical protein
MSYLNLNQFKEAMPALLGTDRGSITSQLAQLKGAKGFTEMLGDSNELSPRAQKTYNKIKSTPRYQSYR